MDKDQIQLMQKAAAEIKALRSENRLQSARLKMFDDCMQLMNAEPPRYGMSSMPTDIVVMLEQTAAKAEAANS